MFIKGIYEMESLHICVISNLMEIPLSEMLNTIRELPEYLNFKVTYIQENYKDLIEGLVLEE